MEANKKQMELAFNQQNKNHFLRKNTFAPEIRFRFLGNFFYD